METKQFDEVVDSCLADPNTMSARVVRKDGTAPLLVAHLYMDGREYVFSLIPTNLEQVELADTDR